MSEKKRVKLGLIGLGNMGRGHAEYLKDMDNVDLVGVCDIVHERADEFANKYHSTAYYSHKELYEKSGLEAVLIAVPHYDHMPIALDAFEKGIHVLCEKPMNVHVNESKKTIAAYENAREQYPDLQFGLMFMERTKPHYLKIKDLVENGDLGQLIRVTWIHTAWFRSQAYYNSGGWRATWAGEGGGVLTNQCPHTVDMYQWLFGVPSMVSGHAHIGKYHDIEVEDEVTAYFEHDNGMIGHMILTTAETPGTNRLEVVGEHGKLIYENGKLTFYRNRMSMLEFSKTTQLTFGNVESWYTEIPVTGDASGPHKKVTENFIDVVIQKGGKLIAHGTEGINQVSIANAIMLSSFDKKEVNIPLSDVDGDTFENKLKELIKDSRFVKTVNDQVVTNMNSSFSK